MTFMDKTLSCRECGGSFVWTAGEQQFYKNRALINVPARCPKCRTARKAKLGLPSSAMTEVVCAECGQATTVPFVPRNGNPVYCSTCLTTVREEAAAQAPAPAPVPVPERLQQSA